MDICKENVNKPSLEVVEALRNSWVMKLFGNKVDTRYFTVGIPKVEDISLIRGIAFCEKGKLHLLADRLSRFAGETASIALYNLMGILEVNDVRFLTYLYDISRLIAHTYTLYQTLSKCYAEEDEAKNIASGLDAVSNLFYTRLNTQLFGLDHLVYLNLITAIGIQVIFVNPDIYRQIEMGIVKLVNVRRKRDIRVLAIGKPRFTPRWNEVKSVEEVWESCGEENVIHLHASPTNLYSFASWKDFLQKVNGNILFDVRYSHDNPFYEFEYRGDLYSEFVIKRLNSVTDLNR